MATWINWSVIQHNEAQIIGQVEDLDGNNIDITDYALSLVIKPTETSDDGDGNTYSPSATTPALGKWSLTIPGSDFGTPGTSWYRLDLIDDDENTTTVNVGNMTVMAA